MTSQRLAELRVADIDLSTLPDGACTRVLMRYLDALADELPDLEPAQHAVVSDVAAELLRAAMEPTLRISSRDARRADGREQVRRYIRAHLGDSALTVESIARAHALSLRALHALFEGSGESVAALVRGLRLARCMEDLGRPAAGSVTDIAFRWGFSDTAHFSRVFKREFGLPPSAVRRQAEEAEIGLLAA